MVVITALVDTALCEAKQMELFVEPNLAEDKPTQYVVIHRCCKAYHHVSNPRDDEREAMDEEPANTQPPRKLVEIELMLPPPTPSLARAPKKYVFIACVSLRSRALAITQAQPE